jgi:signal transduction histidine kinase
VDVQAARRWAGDALLAAALLVFGGATTRLAAQNQPEATPLDWLAYAVMAVAALALVLRRRWPVPVLATVVGATTVYLLLAYPYGPIMLIACVAVYTVASTLPLRPAAWWGAATLVALSLPVLLPFSSQGLGALVSTSAFVAVPFAIGVAVRVTREANARERADAARRIADDERLRVAQEVHDVVGHGLAAINMQAEIALHLLDRKPEQAETALTAISRTSKNALDELKATLTAVRQGADRAPAPGLEQLPALRDRLAHAGLPVTLSVEGTPAELSAAVDLAGYRIAQEALTNVLRHAGAATATVRVSHSAEAVTVEITDTGRGGDVPVNGTGIGIAGMRSRATTLGGTLEAGPRQEGGFRVHAVLPLAAANS